ncbi:MAG: site-specific tyrosine recombinase XerC [Pseudomonadota bacterium]
MKPTSIDISLYPHIRRTNDKLGMLSLMEAYLEAMAIKNYTPSTLNNRKFHLLSFMEWAGQRGLHRPTEITKLILERYQRYLFYYRQKNGSPLSFRSQSNRLIVVRVWFRWLTRQNYLPSNPASELELPKVEKRLPQVLSAREAELILSMPNIDEPLGLRDRTILEVLYSTGIRRLETINLSLYDIDWDRQSLRIQQGKGQKDRIIPIGQRVLNWVSRYVEGVRNDLVCEHSEQALFLNRFGNPLSSRQLSYLVGRYIHASPVKKKGSCHLFRHTMATLMLENGADVRYVQAMLGHEDLSSTEIYTHVSIKKLQEVHRLIHPAKSRQEAQPSDESEPPTAEDLYHALYLESDEEIDDS